MYRAQILDTGVSEAFSEVIERCRCGGSFIGKERCLHLNGDNGNPSDPRLIGFGQLAIGAVHTALDKIENGEGLHPALGLTLDWYFEKGSNPRTFDENHPMTRDLMIHKAVRNAIKD